MLITVRSHDQELPSPLTESGAVLLLFLILAVFLLFLFLVPLTSGHVTQLTSTIFTPESAS